MRDFGLLTLATLIGYCVVLYLIVLSMEVYLDF